MQSRNTAVCTRLAVPRVLGSRMTQGRAGLQAGGRVGHPGRVPINLRMSHPHPCHPASFSPSIVYCFWAKATAEVHRQDSFDGICNINSRDQNGIKLE